MIAGTYMLSGVLLIVTGLLFKAHDLDEISFKVCICVVFFFASAGASAAYLTVSEVFPMETRALCIAVFYAIGTGIGGVIGPQVFSRLIKPEATSRSSRVRARRGDDDPRRRRGDRVRRRRRAAKPREHRPAAHRRRAAVGKS